MTGVSCINHIKMDGIRSDLEINEITEIIEKKRLKCFVHVIDENKASYVNHSYKNDFYELGGPKGR